MRSRKGAAGGKEGSPGPPQRSTPADQPSAHAAASRADDGAGSSGGGAAGEQDSAKFIRSYLGQGAATFARFPGAGSGAEDEKPQTLLKNEDPRKKLRSFATRTASTVVLISGFIFVVWAGHVPLMFFVLMLQALMVRESFGLSRMDQEERKLPGFRLQQWFFFVVATFYLYFRFIYNNLVVEITSTKKAAKILAWLLKRHMLVSYFLYCAGLVSFVLSLKRGMYLYQFSQYGWTHMIILTVIVPTSFFVSNTFQGIIWYLMPAMLIVVNDIFAYLSGFFFGRTPLIRISPKKTWEGFIGAFISTALFAFFASRFMARSSWLTCPRKDLSIGPLHCETPPIFIDKTYTAQELAEELPGPLEEILALLHALLPAKNWEALSSWRVTVMPVQLHAVMMSFFASLISPFGGFFASGFKRAFKLKDFGDTIPGHGGITDRFDCQVLMAVFSYLYYWNYIHVEVPAIVDVLSEALRLPGPQQLELFVRLGNLLAGEGLLPDGMIQSVQHLLPKGTI